MDSTVRARLEMAGASIFIAICLTPALCIAIVVSKFFIDYFENGTAELMLLLGILAFAPFPIAVFAFSWLPAPVRHRGCQIFYGSWIIALAPNILIVSAMSA